DLVYKVRASRPVGEAVFLRSFRAVVLRGVTIAGFEPIHDAGRPLARGVRGMLTNDDLQSVLDRQDVILARLIALESVLVEKGIFTSAELDRHEAIFDSQFDQLLAKLRDDRATSAVGL